MGPTSKEKERERKEGRGRKGPKGRERKWVRESTGSTA